MNESFLHYIWQYQYFDKTNLQTQEGESISIFKTGILNTNAGPDFSQAKIKIGTIEWVGNVEIHTKSSEWLNHKHSSDKAYENVILHVVWENDVEIKRGDGSIIPAIELKGRVDESLIKAYKKLINSPSSIPCEKSFPAVSDLIKLSMLDQALMQRLEAKAEIVHQLLKSNNGDWEETTYQLLLKNFGFKINSEPFLQLAKSLPYKVIQKHSANLPQMEALLFGQAGMLETKTKDEYISLLYREYEFLSKKYSLYESRINPAQWKFLRLRPANFPTLRIAQLSSILYAKKNLLSSFIEADSYEQLMNFFSASPSAYWQTHYHFAKKSKALVPDLGESSKQNLLINTIVPLLVAYSKAKDDARLMERAVEILQHIPAEVNKITKVWATLGVSVKSAFDSQALIEQYNNLCQKRQCLNCAVGASLLKPQWK
jgi:Protein of unknown function (DUF2851)